MEVVPAFNLVGLGGIGGVVDVVGFRGGIGGPTFLADCLGGEETSTG